MEENITLLTAVAILEKDVHVKEGQDSFRL